MSLRHSLNFAMLMTFRRARPELAASSTTDNPSASAAAEILRECGAEP